MDEFPDDVFENMIDLMVISAFLLSKYSYKIMKKRQWGRIINIDSIHGLVASPNKIAYVTAKHAMVGMTKAIALEGILHGITCNAIAPTYVNTDLVHKQIKSQAEIMNVKEERVISEVLMHDSPIKKLLDPKDIANLVLYLCSENAYAVNGAVFTMDYGYTAR